jgi:preprotein translocase subunit SecE
MEYWDILSDLLKVMIIVFGVLAIIVLILYIFDKNK